VLSDVNVVLLQYLPLEMQEKTFRLLSSLTDLLIHKVEFWRKGIIKLFCSFFLDVKFDKEVAFHHVANFSPILVINVLFKLLLQILIKSLVDT